MTDVEGPTEITPGSFDELLKRREAITLEAVQEAFDMLLNAWCPIDGETVSLEIEIDESYHAFLLCKFGHVWIAEPQGDNMPDYDRIEEKLDEYRGVPTNASSSA